MPETDGGFSSASELRLREGHLSEMAAHALWCYPDEGCGLLVGHLATGTVVGVHPAANVAASAQFYTLDPKAYLRVDREASAQGLEVIGVFHSHTRTDPWPSPTDVGQAPDPAWHYVIVSLRLEVPTTRSYRIVEGNIFEERIVVLGRI